MYDLIIIGAGPAGCTAAIYAARYHLKTLVLYADMGQISYAHEIQNYPGYEQINGTALVQNMMAQAIKAGAELKRAGADSIKKKGKSFIVKAGEKVMELFTTHPNMLKRIKHLSHLQ